MFRVEVFVFSDNTADVEISCDGILLFSFGAPSLAKAEEFIEKVKNVQVSIEHIES